MILYQHRVQSSLDMHITTLMDKQLGCILVEAHCGEESRRILEGPSKVLAPRDCSSRREAGPEFSHF